MIRWKTGLGFLLGILGPIALPWLLSQLVGAPAQPRMVYVPQSFIETSDALDRYLTDHGRMPTAAEGLAALVPQYLPSVATDPWTGKPYLYEPILDGRAAELLSLGADAKAGGVGADADISLQALSMGPPPPPAVVQGAWLINASFLLTPVLGMVGAYRWSWVAGVLSGSTFVAGMLLGSIALALVTTVPGLMIALSTAFACLLAAIMVWLEKRGARPFALVATVLAWAQLTLLAA